MRKYLDLKTYLRLLRTDLYRGFCSWSFWLTVALMVSVGVLSSGSMLFSEEYSVCEIAGYLFSGSGSADLLIMVFPLLPYTLAYAREEQENAVGFWVVRSGAGKYMAAKVTASCLMALASVMVFFAILAVILLLKGHLLYNPKLEVLQDPYDILRLIGHPVGYLLLYSAHYGLGGALMAGCAVWISSLYPSWFLALTGPVCLNNIALRLINIPYGEAYVKYDFFRVANWNQMIYEVPGGVLPTFLVRLGSVSFVCAAFCLMSVYNVRRRWHDA